MWEKVLIIKFFGAEFFFKILIKNCKLLTVVVHDLIFYIFALD